MPFIDSNTVLFHATSIDRIAGIVRHGLNHNSHWSADRAMSDYYMETVKDEGRAPIILSLKLADLHRSLLKPDHMGLEEPITTVLRMKEDEVNEAWEESDQDWRSSLEILKTLKYTGSIPVTKLRVIDANDESHMLLDYVVQHMPEVTLPGPEYLDPFVRRIYDFLGPEADAVYEVLGQANGSGPFDGGCLYFAQGLQQVKGGDIYVLASDIGAQHAMLFSDGLFYDAGGPGTYGEMVDRIYESENRDLNIRYARPLNGSDFPEIDPNPEVVQQLAALLARHAPEMTEQESESPGMN